MTIRVTLRTQLTNAMKSRDADAMAALRSAMAAIGNAEAVSVEAPRSGAIEASPVGVGAAEAPRRELTEADLIAIVSAEVDERREAVQHLSDERASSVLAEIAVLEALLAS